MSEWDKTIELDASVTILFEGTEVPVYLLFEYLEAGDSVEDFLLDYPSVTRDGIKRFFQTARDEVRKQAA